MKFENQVLILYALYMKIVLYCIVFLFISTFFYGYPIYSSLKKTKNIEIKTTKYQQNPHDVALHFLVAGDSTGVGTGAAESTQSTAGLLGQMYPTAIITNISENGLKLADVAEKLSLITENYDLILLQVGANDIIGFTQYDTIEQELQEILSIATKHSKKVIVITSGNIGLSPVFRFPLSNFITNRTRKVREIFIKTIIKYPNVQYVDLFQNKENDVFHKNISKYYAHDLFHPSSEGYNYWFKKIKEVL